jgi:iron(III) transport system permease protein
LVILGTALAAAFIEAWPYKLTFSLQHFQFEDSGFEGWLAFSNSLIVASFSAIFGTILVFVGALLTEKHAANLVWKKPLHSLAMLPMATPGLVLGLGYVLFFNHPQNPLNGLYGSLTLLVLCSIAHFYTTAHLTALTALKQLNLALEVAALTLKVPFWVTAWRVTLPICLPACVDIARYFFIASMTTVSAVAFLYTPDTLLASISVLSMDDMGDTAAAAAMSSLIFISCVLACGVFSLLNALLSKRHQAWQRQF